MLNSLEVIQSTISRSKIYALLFSPLLLLVFVGMCAGIEFTPIYTCSDYLKSNRTYVGDAVKQNTGLTFNEYINQRRVNYIVEQLKRNPETSLPKLFAYVGYNQRTTAVRNFQKITGVTPAEFIESIKQ